MNDKKPKGCKGIVRKRSPLPTVAALRWLRRMYPELKKPKNGKGFMLVAEEVSDIPEMGSPETMRWVKRFRVLGSPWPCKNFFR